MTHRLRVAWAGFETPDRAGNAGQRRQYFLIKGLVDRGHDVRVLALEGSQSTMGIASLVQVETLPLRGRRTIGDGRPRWQRRITSGDVAVISHVESIQLLGRRWPKEFPLVVDFHNVHSREAARSGRGDEEGRALALERRALEACSIAVASSTDESAALTSLNAERPVVTVAQGYDPDEWPPGTRAFDGRTVCFFGSLDFGPNIDGLRWFLTQCWPHVLRRMPAAQLMLYGKGAPPSDIREHPGVRVIGWVERLSEAIAGSSCVIVPNVGGPGTRVKLPEAMASGLPVVVTRHGAEGIDAPNALSIADDPAIFGGLVATYLVDAEAARLAGQRARAYAERWCGWSERAGELERALHAAVAMVVQ